MTDHKADLIHQLDAQRDDLWALLNGIDPAVELYPGWFKREFFAHIAGWEAAVFEIFRDHIAGVPFKTYSHNNLHDVDGANNAFVAERAKITLPGAQLECEINRFAIKALLEDIPAASYDQPIAFPWGQESVASWIAGAINHERTHAAEIRAVTQST